ncbi:cupin domain-containing protein [Alteraurantiacibacter aquimixticola]|uniref:Cupin domain-containing protein n=1 Tax=Alteraurantiacibacter aquimixticola TaxID=2489173 RepID=A0A4T3F2W0_9SPHN|nr:cupin domain-containing protein [Alteraurantiacibacter aquimixticola]TIX49765.1 cupin domain-containing protein [Alteraurantiacibacter aquimixticola]
MSAARDLIERLNLAPHPEGGWYRELWRGADGGDGRAVATSIHFLLEAGQKSHWHRVDAAEIWLWHAGDPLDLWLSASDEGPMRSVTLGADAEAGQVFQHVVEPGEWQGAMPVKDGAHGYSLVSCVVAPGFEFAGFTLAPPDWYPGKDASG